MDSTFLPLLPTKHQTPFPLHPPSERDDEKQAQNSKSKHWYASFPWKSTRTAKSSSATKPSDAKSKPQLPTTEILLDANPNNSHPGITLTSPSQEADINAIVRERMLRKLYRRIRPPGLSVPVASGGRLREGNFGSGLRPSASEGRLLGRGCGEVKGYQDGEGDEEEEEEEGRQSGEVYQDGEEDGEGYQEEYQEEYKEEYQEVPQEEHQKVFQERRGRRRSRAEIPLRR